MKKLLRLLTFAAVFAVLFAGVSFCPEGDNVTTTDPRAGTVRISASFSCTENSGHTTLTCTDSTTGGLRPYIYNWFADGQDGKIAVSQNRVVFNYAKVCEDTDENQTVVVKMEVTDSATPAEQDTTELPYTLCEPVA